MKAWQTLRCVQILKLSVITAAPWRRENLQLSSEEKCTVIRGTQCHLMVAEKRKHSSHKCFRKKGEDNKHGRRKSIGIFGVQQGVGVTHLCTALTHYCADCLKSHTALVELSGNHELEELQKQQQGKWGRPDRKHYFANAESDNMPEYIRQGYEYYIIDGGSEFYRIRREFLRCDRKLILVSLSPWKRKELEYFMSVIWEEEKCLDNVTFLAQLDEKR